jgi:hypothetical protein
MRAEAILAEEQRCLVGSSHRRPAWELTPRNILRLPGHYTANDSAGSLLRCAACAFAVGVLFLSLSPAIFGWPIMVAACTISGLAIGQYSHYTGRIGVDCWSDESVPVLGIMLFAGALVGFTSGLAVLLPRTVRTPALMCLCVALLVVPRALVPVVGSLYDGTAKSSRRRD